MSSAIASSSRSISSLARATTASRRASRAPVSRATSGGRASDRSSSFMRRMTSAAAVFSVGVSWAASGATARATTMTGSDRAERILSDLGLSGGTGSYGALPRWQWAQPTAGQLVSARAGWLLYCYPCRPSQLVTGLASGGLIMVPARPVVRLALTVVGGMAALACGFADVFPRRPGGRDDHLRRRHDAPPR